MPPTATIMALIAGMIATLLVVVAAGTHADPVYPNNNPPRHLADDDVPEACVNAIANIESTDHVQLGEAKQNLHFDLQKSFLLQDPDRCLDGKECDIDQGTSPSTETYKQACVGEAQGSVVEYYVQLKCYLQATTTQFHSSHQAIYNVWNLTYCAPVTPGPCTYRHLANVMEDEGFEFVTRAIPDHRTMFGSSTFDALLGGSADHPVHSRCDTDTIVLRWHNETYTKTDKDMDDAAQKNKNQEAAGGKAVPISVPTITLVVFLSTVSLLRTIFVA